MIRSERRAPPSEDGEEGLRSRVCLVGPGTRFLSGITYYTYGLISALSKERPVSAILLRRLLPQRLYPGRARVGASLSELSLPESVPRFDGLDWYWGRGLWQSYRQLRRERPQVLVLQWWTGAVLHTYLLLGLLGRISGAQLVVEFHEGLDSGEERLRGMRLYVGALAPLLLWMTSAFVVHSEFDRRLVTRRYGIDPARTTVIPHPAYDHHRGARVEAPSGPCRLLYFGVVRPFKGLEDLVRAFELLCDGSDQFSLTVVGETWEGWELPDQLIEGSRHRGRITRIARYVTDSEATELFGKCDLVVLPYRRCSSSGPLHIAMALGLPVVTTDVGGLPEATSRYPGAVLTPPADPERLAEGIRRAAGLRGQLFGGVPDWANTAERYGELVDRLGEVAARRGRPAWNRERAG